MSGTSQATLSDDPGPRSMAGRDIVAPANGTALHTQWIDFYDAEYHLLVRFLMKVGASLEDADDAAAEAFVESWSLVTHRPETWLRIQNPRAWIRTVALRKFLRPPGRRRRPLLDSDAEIPDIPDTGLEPGELTAQTQAVLQALRSLDSEARTVMAFHMDGFPTTLIADALGISDQRVRDVTKKARRILARTLARSGVLEPASGS